MAPLSIAEGDGRVSVIGLGTSVWPHDSWWWSDFKPEFQKTEDWLYRDGVCVCERERERERERQIYRERQRTEKERQRDMSKIACHSDQLFGSVNWPWDRDAWISVGLQDSAVVLRSGRWAVTEMTPPGRKMQGLWNIPCLFPNPCRGGCYGGSHPEI